MGNGDLGWITKFWGIAEAAMRDLAAHGNFEEAPSEADIGKAAV
jgi:hypothetical protein